MQITPVSEHVGALVSDVDVTHLTDGDVAELDAAWAQHGVLFFRDQTLTPDQHIEFAERFAPIDVNRFFTPVATHPRIAEVRKEPDQTANIGGGWHTDHSYDEIPARGSILVAREVPPSGGDTVFLGVGAAYDALPHDVKERIVGLRATHSNEHVFGATAMASRAVGDRIGNPDGVGSTTHPVAIAHPVTGRSLLYVNMGFTTDIVGLDADESKELLDQLLTHMLRDEFTYRFQWQPGSIAMWDNRATWHWAVNDYQGHRRLMHRITIQGDPLAEARAA